MVFRLMPIQSDMYDYNPNLDHTSVSGLGNRYLLKAAIFIYILSVYSTTNLHIDTVPYICTHL